MANEIPTLAIPIRDKKAYTAFETGRIIEDCLVVAYESSLVKEGKMVTVFLESERGKANALGKIVKNHGLTKTDSILKEPTYKIDIQRWGAK